MPLTNFKNHINNNFPFLNESKLVIAISGGIDSVVLAHLCKSLNLDFVFAHCNFNLRGEESNADEAFVLELAEELGVECFVQNFDTNAYAELNKCSIQMAARELRYDWFQDIVSQLEFDYILTAHHADDNLETFLINFTRGTGLNGLTGIPAINNNIARPLLQFSRGDVENYAKENNIKWREDSSNSSRKYLRNKLRHEIVPILKEINPQLLDSFQNTLVNLKDTADIVEEGINAFKKRAEVSSGFAIASYKIPEFKALKNPKAYLFEIFKNYGFTEWNDVVDLLDSQSGKFILSHTHRLIKHRDLLLLSEIKSEIDKPILIEENATTIEMPLGELQLKTVAELLGDSTSEIYIDKAKLKYPLTLRIWNEGDVFQPSGMTGKKKISKYLKDEKASLLEKENTWLLLSKGEVVWVVGKRIDERFRTSETTKNILKIKIG